MIMRTNKLAVALFLAAALAWLPALTFSQPAQDSGVKKDAHQAGHETADAAKDTGHGVKKGTEKAYDATRKDTTKAYHSTEKGAKKVWSKTKDTTKGAIHGGEEGAKQPQK